MAQRRKTTAFTYIQDDEFIRGGESKYKIPVGGSFNPVSSYKDPRRRQKMPEIVIRNTKEQEDKLGKVIQKPTPQHLQTPYVYIQKVVQKYDSKLHGPIEESQLIVEHPDIWNPSLNKASWRVVSDEAYRDQIRAQKSGMGLKKKKKKTSDYLEMTNLKEIMAEYFNQLNRLLFQRKYYEKTLGKDSHQKKATLLLDRLFDKWQSSNTRGSRNRYNSSMSLNEGNFKQFMYMLGFTNQNSKWLSKIFRLCQNIQNRQISIKALRYNFNKYFKEQKKVHYKLSEKKYKLRNADLKFYLKTESSKLSEKSDYKKFKKEQYKQAKQMLAYFCKLERQKIDYILNEKTEEAFKNFLEYSFRRKVIISFLSKDEVMSQEFFEPHLLQGFLEEESAFHLDQLNELGNFIKQFKVDKKNLKEEEFTLVEFGNEIYVRRVTKEYLDILQGLVEKVKKRYRSFHDLQKNQRVNPNKPIKLTILTSAYDSMVQHTTKKLKIVHDLLEYLNQFVFENLPENSNKRVKRKLTLNLTSYLLLKKLTELDQQVLQHSANIENILNVILQSDTQLNNFRARLQNVLNLNRQNQPSLADKDTTDLVDILNKPVLEMQEESSEEEQELEGVDMQRSLLVNKAPPRKQQKKSKEAGKIQLGSPLSNLQNLHIPPQQFQDQLQSSIPQTFLPTNENQGRGIFGETVTSQNNPFQQRPTPQTTGQNFQNAQKQANQLPQVLSQSQFEGSNLMGEQSKVSFSGEKQENKFLRMIDSLVQEPQHKKSFKPKDIIQESHNFLRESILEMEGDKLRTSKSLTKEMAKRKKRDPLIYTESQIPMQMSVQNPLYVKNSVKFGKSMLKSGIEHGQLVSEQQVIYPQEYYTSVLHTEMGLSHEKFWFLRPHHIETLTEHPASVKDNVLDTKFISRIKQIPIEEQVGITKEYLEDERKKEIKSTLIKDIDSELQMFSFFPLSHVYSLKNQARIMQRSGMKHSIRRKNNWIKSGPEHFEHYISEGKTMQEYDLMMVGYEGMLNELRNKEKSMFNKF